MIEPISEAMDDRAFQPVMIENRAQNKTGDLGLAPHDLLRLNADARKHRIDVAKTYDVSRNF
jgi:hypothetical protein